MAETKIIDLNEERSTTKSSTSSDFKEEKTKPNSQKERPLRVKYF